MIELEIRSYGGADHDAVVALWQRVFAGDPARNAPAEMIRRKLTVQPELFLVGVVGGQVVATVMAGFDGVRGWIYHLAVAEGLRRRGIATRMMAVAEAKLVALGCPKVNLQVRATNAQVIAFYEALGYAVEERVSMGKRLA